MMNPLALPRGSVLPCPRCTWTRAFLLLLTALFAVGCASGDGKLATEWHATFDDGAGWQLSSDAVADVSVTGGVLQVHVFDAGQVAWASSQDSWGDVHLTVEATQVSGPHDNEYGVLLRMGDDQHFYAFSISGDGYARVARYDNGSWTVLGPDWVPNDAINRGEATNLIEVIAQGTAFAFRVNGQSVLEIDDAAFTLGTVGLYAGAFSEGDVVVAFDNLDVVPLP